MPSLAWQVHLICINHLSRYCSCEKSSSRILARAPSDTMSTASLSGSEKSASLASESKSFAAKSSISGSHGFEGGEFSGNEVSSRYTSRVLSPPKPRPSPGPLARRKVKRHGAPAPGLLRAVDNKVDAPPFQKRQISDSVKGLVLDIHKPAPLGFVVLQFHDFIHHELPDAGCDLRVANQQIGAGDLKIDDRLLVRFVPGVKQPLGGRTVFCPQGLLFSNLVVLAPKDRATAVRTKD
jgi:hypothetical protein